jgi:predicted anti-sigma-YlaC factor YlaD
MSEHCKDCSETLGILSEYIDGELAECLCAEIEHHMAECGNCRIMVDTLRKTVIRYRD